MDKVAVPARRVWGMALLLWMLLSGCAQYLVPEYIRLESTARYRELAVYEESEVKRSGVSSASLYRLCYAYSKLKNYNKLFDCLDQLSGQIEKGDKEVALFTSISSSDGSPTPHLMRAEAYLEMGDYSKAIAEAEKGYNLTANVRTTVMGIEKSQHTIHALGLLGLAHVFHGDREKGIAYLKTLKDLPLAFTGSAVSKPLKDRAVSRIYIALGAYDRALQYLQDDEDKGLRTFTSALLAGGENLFATIELPNDYMVNKCLFETGKTKEAKAGFDVLLNIPQTRNIGEIYWLMLYDRGRIAEQESDRPGAIHFYRRAIEVIEEQRSSIHTEASKIGFVGDKQAVYHNLVVALFKDGQYEKAFEYVERAKARALVDMLATKKDFAFKEGNEQEIRTALATNDSAEYEAIMQDESIDKNKTRSIKVRTREALKNKAPELASLVTVTSRSVSELQSLLPGDEALIEYYYRDKDIYAFILSDGRLQTIHMDSEGLAEDVQAFRRLMDTPSSTPFKGMSEKLYKRLFLPLEKALNKRNLIIVSHGAMHYLPMNALYDGKGYLMDRYSIRMMPSAGAMKYLGKKKTAGKGGILAFGNPDLGDPRYDLEYAQREAIEIAGIIPNSKVFSGKGATEEALRTNCRDYRYLHFATHGQFNPEAPLKSALLLAPDARYNGLLTVDKLYSLHLDVDLVTLSACETGLSKIANGDDLVGLIRGFLYAGSSSIVASLWKVDDLATSQLMARFYRELDKTNKREALRRAQLETKKKYPHPYYWASFQLTGSAN